jgi:hypothetical protein
MQWSFHELAHASFFMKVGQTYWIRVITNILVADASLCDGYGCGNEIFAGDTQLNEAWAEYLGKDHHRRVHPNGQSEVTNLGWLNYPEALENGTSFTHIWIPTGVFFDLTDPNSTSISENLDNITGFSNAQMYNIFSPNIHSFCDYEAKFISQFRTVTVNQFDDLLRQNLHEGCIK